MEGNTRIADTKSTQTKKPLVRLTGLGPAIITAALVLGPGSLTLSTKIGAVYGLSLLWTLLTAIVLMMVFTEMSTRIGLASKDSFIVNVRKKWGKGASLLIGIGAFLVTASFQSGNALGSGLAIASVTGLPVSFWILLTTGGAIFLLFAKNFYKVLERMMILLVGLMLFSFLTTLVVSKPSLQLLSSGLQLSLPEGSMPLVIALTATTFSIVGACYQSYLIQEKGWGLTDASQAVKESYAGILILGVISLIVMMSAASILLPKGVTVDSAAEMGMSLQPLYGDWAVIIFMLGLFGASFSSLTGNAAIGGSLLADSLGKGSKLNTAPVRYLIIAVMLLGAVVALAFGQAPLEMIIFAQAITIVVVPFIGFALLMVANDAAIMGKFKNKAIHNVLAVIGLIILLLLAGNNLYQMIF
ncbi:Nramp family divalent metal transporter [Bacillus sp. SJS]|uniref:Nramp family divalent metal transporter n=1 Tax=Bacillus sp. SJS TaxID=1423321 RepID=UPI000B0117D1|nr:Nramp family divalent metal transporter [Bacillus sp. SJS]